MHNNSDFKIDFTGIGAPKAATSWIIQCIREHPESCINLPKETNFFLTKRDPDELGAYRKLFSKCDDNALLGEFSHQYLYSDEARTQIKTLFPDTRLIVSIRNPIERALSLYYYRKSKRKDIPESFEETIGENTAYTEQGMYWKYLSKWLEDFDRTQIHIIVYEDIQKNPARVMRDVYTFLEIDASFTPPSLHEPRNVTATNKLRIKSLGRTLKKLEAPFLRLPKRGMVRTLIRRLRVDLLIRQIRKWNVREHRALKKLEAKPIDTNTRTQLQHVYAKDIEALEAFLGRDLHWK